MRCSDANIIYGAIIDENLGDELVITVIATGFKGNVPGQPEKEEETNPFFKLFKWNGDLSSTQSAPSYNQAPPQPAPSYTPPSPGHLNRRRHLIYSARLAKTTG